MCTLEQKREKITSQYQREVFDAEAMEALSTKLAREAATPAQWAENYKRFAELTPILLYDFDSFPDHVYGLKLLHAAKQNGYSACYNAHPALRKRERERWSQGAYRAEIDFDHISPDWSALLSLGYAGLAARLREHSTGDEFRTCAAEACDAVCHLLSRMGTEAERAGLVEMAVMLRRLARGKPETLQDALTLMIITHRLLDTEIASVCTLGGFDRLLGKFVDEDIACGRLTREDAVDLFAEFFIKYDASMRLNPGSTSSYLGKSFFIGGLAEGDVDVTNETTFIVMDAVVKAGVLSPKLAIRLSEKTPDALYKRIVRFIREEKGHAVLCGDRPAMAGLQAVGISPAAAYGYAPIGCYEPAVVGKEVGCTGATSLNIAKAVELALHRGVDPLSGVQIGAATPDCGDFPDFESFLDAVKCQLTFLTQEIMLTQRTWESHYPAISPALLLSATMESCVTRGRSAYDGGAVYANTACNCGSIASAADSLHMIRKLVFEKKELTLTALRDIVDANWEGHELLQLKIKNDREKWGNGVPAVDALACALAAYTSSLLTGHPNGRGGVFKAGLYSIDRAYYFGHATGATPDGRCHKEVLSKNLCPTIGMDYSGVTAEIGSVLTLDHARYPNGSVLDLMLHPTTVSGDEGLAVLEGLIRTYIDGGGFGVQFNIFDAETLRAAQAEPEKYRNLQIRLCGWNVYFVQLSKEQQDDFIREASL